MEDKEIWVFLSHSNKDYDKVRVIRNMLEEENLRPLMFFLTCLDDEEEINDLIKREIDSRKRFILCDSENARNSKWVQKEVAYIKSKQRIYQTINIDNSIEDIKKELIEFAKNARVYISASTKDNHYYEKLADMLRVEWDYQIFKPKTDIVNGSDYADIIRSQIDMAIDKGLIYFLITENFIHSQWCMTELMYALNKKTDNQIVIIRKRSVELPEWVTSQSVRIVDASMENGNFETESDEYFFFQIMQPQISCGVKDDNPNALYQLANHLYLDERFDYPSMSGMRDAAARHAKKAAELGHWEAESLYKSIIRDYPELK